MNSFQIKTKWSKNNNKISDKVLYYTILLKYFFFFKQIFSLEKQTESFKARYTDSLQKTKTTD